MNKLIKYLVLFLLIDALLIGGYFGIRAVTTSKAGKDRPVYDWVTVDHAYYPQNLVEDFIKKDAQSRDLLPVYIRNFDQNPRMLRKFRGKNFANPREPQLRMMFNNLQDWMLIEMKYKDKREREIQVTHLYVLVNEEWRVADTGKLSD